MINQITSLLNHYGYIVLLIALYLELIAFPLPGELLMTYCGFLVYKGNLDFVLCVIFAIIGSILGITTSYTIGKKIGIPFFNRYGKYVHLGPDKLNKTSKWFDQYGDRLLIFAFFIIGVRHITGYFSGITKINYKRFALNAYLGATIWCLTFIYLGKVFGSNWKYIHTKASYYLFFIALSIIVVLILIYLFRTYQKQILKFINKYLKRLLSLYQSYGKIKLIITGIIAVTFTFLLLLIGIIQDFLANEFTTFDNITLKIINESFNTHWTDFMTLVLNLSTLPIVTFIIFLLLLWILKVGKNKWLEIQVILIVFIGGIVIQRLLVNLFKLLKFSHTFPSAQTFFMIITYGIVIYFLMLYHKNMVLNHILFIIYIFLSLFIGISYIYVNQAYPIDVVAGYIIGGFWLGINLILLEINRLLLKFKNERSNDDESR